MFITCSLREYTRTKNSEFKRKWISRSMPSHCAFNRSTDLWHFPQTSFRVICIFKTRAHRVSVAHLSAQCQSVVCFGFSVFFTCHTCGQMTLFWVRAHRCNIAQKTQEQLLNFISMIVCFLHTFHKISIYGKNIFSQKFGHTWLISIYLDLIALQCC